MLNNFHVSLKLDTKKLVHIYIKGQQIIIQYHWLSQRTDDIVSIKYMKWE